MCGDPIEENPPSLIAAGGWCAPTAVTYDLDNDPMCSDCKARWLMVMELGIDPGRHGENLKIPRGGIQYTKEEK
jgi:hypothetical protein